jgi:hypothetical protein
VKANWEVRINGEVVFVSGSYTGSANVLASTLYHAADDAYVDETRERLLSLGNRVVANQGYYYELIDDCTYELVRVVTV